VRQRARPIAGLWTTLVLGQGVAPGNPRAAVDNLARPVDRRSPRSPPGPGPGGSPRAAWRRPPL